MFFFKNHAENGGETSSRPPLFIFKKKKLYEVKTSGQYLSFDIFWYSSKRLSQKVLAKIAG